MSSFHVRKQHGNRALQRALQLLREWGFHPILNGVEFTATPEELEGLHRDPRELSWEELCRRFAPDLQISALVEVKMVRDLEAPIVPAWGLLAHLELAREGEIIIYLFIDPAGDYKWVPIARLRPQVLFLTDPADIQFFREKFPDVDIVLLKRTNGSGAPFLRCHVTP